MASRLDGELLIEIGTSPMPGMPTMLNCPWANGGGVPRNGDTAMVTTSLVSTRLATTR
jgi:hypothetical protein